MHQVCVFSVGASAQQLRGKVLIICDWQCNLHLLNDRSYQRNTCASSHFLVGSLGLVAVPGLICLWDKPWPQTYTPFLAAFFSFSFNSSAPLLCLCPALTRVARCLGKCK